jgi:hypothetical protein
VESTSAVISLVSFFPESNLTCFLLKTNQTTLTNILQTHVDLVQNSDTENQKIKPQKAKPKYAKVPDYYNTPIRGGNNVSQSFLDCYKQNLNILFEILYSSLPKVHSSLFLACGADQMFEVALIRTRTSRFIEMDQCKTQSWVILGVKHDLKQSNQESIYQKLRMQEGQS